MTVSWTKTPLLGSDLYFGAASRKGSGVTVGPVPWSILVGRSGASPLHVLAENLTWTEGHDTLQLITVPELHDVAAASIAVYDRAEFWVNGTMTLHRAQRT